MPHTDWAKKKAIHVVLLYDWKGLDKGNSAA